MSEEQKVEAKAKVLGWPAKRGSGQPRKQKDEAPPAPAKPKGKLPPTAERIKALEGSLHQVAAQVRDGERQCDRLIGAISVLREQLAAEEEEEEVIDGA